MLDEKLWDHESLQQLRQQIADKTEQIPGEAQGRRSLQDFVELPNYLTDSLWQTLLDRKTSGQEALELVCQHAALLGLRLPSESTMAMLLTLAYQGQALAMSGKAKFHLQQKQKPLIRKLLAGPRPLIWLTPLPAEWTDLPAERRERAFPGGARPAPIPSGCVDFGGVAKQWPVRNTNRLVCKGDAGSSSVTAGPSALEKMADAVMSTAKLACQAASLVGVEPREYSTSTGARGATAQQPIVLAIKDKEAEATKDKDAEEGEEEVRQADHTRETLDAEPKRDLRVPQPSLQEKLRALRGELGTRAVKRERENPGQESDPGGVLRRPSVRRRPSAGPSQMRKPASGSCGKKSGPSGDGPDTCKRYASRCYNAARKQALNRGKDAEAALEAARKAHRKAVAEWQM